MKREKMNEKEEEEEKRKEKCGKLIKQRNKIWWGSGKIGDERKHVIKSEWHVPSVMASKS